MARHLKEELLLMASGGECSGQRNPHLQRPVMEKSRKEVSAAGKRVKRS